MKPPANQKKPISIACSLLTILALTSSNAVCAQPLQPPIAKVAPLTSEVLEKRINVLRKAGAPAVALSLPKLPLYVGSYVRVPVFVDPRLGIQFDDLDVRVAEGPPGGIVSPSRDATFDLRKPHVLLIAGFRPGAYTLAVSHRQTGKLLEKAPFEVTVHVPQGKFGPSFVIQGMSEMPAAGAAWGGGPSGLQNNNTNPATGTRRIALLFVDTNEQRFTADVPTLDGFRQTWRQHIRDGVMISGAPWSLRRAYQEASRSLMDVSLDLFGPYQMSGNWDQVGTGTTNNWVGHAQAAITAADGDVDYNNYDTVLVVSQSVGAVGAADAKFAWPTASIGEWNGWSTGDGTVTLGSIQMPNDWTARDGRQIYETASHELGHNLGLGDQYTPSVAGRNPGSWELMHAEGGLPNFTLAHKLRLGWVDPSWVRGFNFATGAVPVDQTLTLAPVNQGAPAPGRVVGAEIRVTDGLNYYFELRKDNPAQIADRSLPTNYRILGTDVRSGTYSPPFSRPDILLLPNDADGDGAVLGDGQNYREDDNTDPIYPVEFRADASGMTGTTANLRIRYGVNDKPDPSIRPWGAPPWQTSDIEVRNARNAVDSAWFNVPWAGNPNQVVGKVKNNGLLDAPSVRVNFYVKNYNIGGAPEAFLGSDVKDIPAGGTVEFQTDWVPPAAGHYCIVVRIPLYTRTGTPAVTELTELNNIAQSNYDRFISATASPGERMITSVEVGNPYPRATRVYVSAGQNNPFYRTYLEHKWLDLNPGETRRVTVMFEYADALAPTFRGPDKDKIREMILRPNRVQLTSYIVDPADRRNHAMHKLGGADVEVVTGRAVKFGQFDVERGLAAGVVTTTDGKPVQSGAVILTMRHGSGKELKVSNVSGKLKGGRFQIAVPIKEGTVQGYFVPPRGYGDATSVERKVGRK